MNVSVIIPYYKNAVHIERSISSALSQTFQDFEVIVINDASPDWNEGLEIINAFQDNRIKTISHKLNKNGAAARNTGIKASKGNYIAFLDSDDEWKPNHLETSLKFMEDYKADLVYASCLVLSKNKFTLPKKGIEKSKSLAEYLFCDDGFIATPSIVVRKNKMMTLLFNENLQRHQDYDFLLRAEHKGFDIVWSQMITVIVHWEDNNLDAKGGTINYSLKWFEEYKKYMTKKAQSYFLKKFVVDRYFEKKNIMNGLSFLFTKTNFLYFNIKEWYKSLIKITS